MFFNLRCEFLSFHIQLIQIDKQIFVFFCFVLFVFFLISCFLVSDERFILLKWMLRRSLLHSFALDVFLLLLRRQVVIKSIMFWQEPTKSNLMGSWFWLRLTRPNYLVFICFVFFAVFGVVVVAVFFFFFFFYKTWIKDVT